MQFSVEPQLGKIDAKSRLSDITFLLETGEREKRIYNVLLDYFFEISKEYEVVALMLYGSQNYELDTYSSDFDAKAIVLPTFNDFVEVKKPTSTDKNFGALGIVDIKDIRLMFDNFRKQNINFVELLFSDFVVYNPKYIEEFSKLMNMRDSIARYNTFAAVQCMRGMAMEKFHALKKEYPSTMHKIQKFGYDPKQLHHILRIEEFMRRYISGEDYKQCLVSKKPDYLKEIKAGVLGEIEAEDVAIKSLKKIDTMRIEYMDENKPHVDKSVEDGLRSISLSILKRFFREQLCVS